jgi:undecaprenyl-diphosphatase
LATELSASDALPRANANKALAWHLFAAYFAAWGVGIAYGAFIRATSTWDEGSAWEREMLRWFHDRALPPWLDTLVLQIPLTGTNLTILPLTLAVGWWLWKHKGRGIIALQLLVVTTGSLSLNPTMKYLLGRDRPDLFPRRGMYNWASYPSGHAILTIAVYMTVALLLYRSRGWRWPFLVAVAVFLANSYSRLYLAVHWPTDLVGGLLIGIVWLIGTWRAFSRHPAHRAALE